MQLIILEQKKKNPKPSSQKKKKKAQNSHHQIYKVLLDRRKAVHAEKNPLPDFMVDALGAGKKNIKIAADFPWKYVLVT